jgi:hypothetical protein
MTGGLIDFVEYPRGLGREDIKSIILHVRRKGIRLRHMPSEVHWCVFSR